MDNGEKKKLNIITEKVKEEEEEGEEEKEKEEEEEYIGCSHYKRKCMIKSPCCSKFYGCRRCHDKIENGYDKKIEDQHEIDRYKISIIQCLKCKNIQKISNKCEKCNIEFAKYYCSICKFFDDDKKKQIFHCIECNICRIGKREDYRHCSQCCMCIINNAFDNHKCRVNSFKSNCPVCLLPLFNSTKSLAMINCGHHMHRICYLKMLKSGNIKCPICMKRMIDKSEDEEKYIDGIIQNTKMPKEYENVFFKILCNECNEKNEVKFHFYGMKCPKCSSYNTRRL